MADRSTDEVVAEDGYGKAMDTWAYYDQIGGVTAASKIDGFKLQEYP
jgi:hypothetical protein